MSCRLRLSILIACALLCLSVRGEEPEELREVIVNATRPLREAGLMKSEVDSVMLHDNIAQTMADVLAYNSSLYVKNYGRATLSTVAFRGTSPSHTQVIWNGIKINNPMLGMTDFSMIPGFFVDRASLFHGNSSAEEAGGAIGGLVRLSTTAIDIPTGFSGHYVQGVGSFTTFDEFLRLAYRKGNFASSTRVAVASSPNDYTYTNHDKKENIYSPDNPSEIVGQYHPREKNRSGAYRDINILQEFYFDLNQSWRGSARAWYTDSRRELALLTTDYSSQDLDFENVQRERTFRGVASFDYATTDTRWRASLKGGGQYSHTSYDYWREVAPGQRVTMNRTRSSLSTVFAQGQLLFTPAREWIFTASAELNQHFVDSRDLALQSVTGAAPESTHYDCARLESSLSLSAKWQATRNLGLSALLRQDVYGSRMVAPVPGLYADYQLLRVPVQLGLRASVTRNNRFPTLNDLYFLPGGNPRLLNESGWTYDCGLTAAGGVSGLMDWEAEISWFDSRINNWILWLPTPKGFFTPRNIERVHARGIEGNASLDIRPHRHWRLMLHGAIAWTPSESSGFYAGSEADRSTGKQLPYVPRFSASVNGRLEWRRWALCYKWAHYSRRYTMSSNDPVPSGSLAPYYMNNISLEKVFAVKAVELQAKLLVNNLFNEDYVTILSRPMPGINFEAFLGVKF